MTGTTGKEWKQRLLQAAQKAEAEGLCRHKTGNFSLFDREAGLIYITPSGLARAELKPEDIVVVTPDGAIAENANERRPSVELTLHRMAYEARPDICAVAHTHTPYATAFGVKGIPIRPVASEAEWYGKKTQLVPAFPHGTVKLAEAVARSIKKADVCLLRNHGVLTVAGSIEEACLKAAYVESAAKIDYLSRTLPG